MRGSLARIIAISERQLGVFTRRQALKCGFSPQAIDRRLVSGAWIRVHRAVYRVAGTPLSAQARVLGALLAVGAPSHASHETAGALWQLIDAPHSVHVTVPDGRRVRLPGIIVHRTAGLRRGDVTRLGEIPVTSPGRTLIDLAQRVGPVALEDCLDDALRRGLVGAARLGSRVRVLGTSGRRGMGTLERFLAERSERGVTGSPLEDRFRRLLARAKLPEPVRQFEVRDRSGRLVGRVDFAYPAAQIAIEVDGYAFHSGRRAWQHDLERQNALVDAGWLVLRFTKKDVDRDAPRVLLIVRRALEQRLAEVSRPR